MAYPGMSVYATTKWGIEGFFEGVIPEIAKFGIEVTLVEHGLPEPTSRVRPTIPLPWKSMRTRL